MHKECVHKVSMKGGADILASARNVNKNLAVGSVAGRSAMPQMQRFRP